MIKRSMSNPTIKNAKDFHARFSVLSAIRNLIKLKLWNCSHRRHSERIVHRGSIIEIIIPEDYFIMFHCSLVHFGTPSWFISRGEYSSNTRAFFTIVEKYFNLNHDITVQKKK